MKSHFSFLANLKSRHYIENESILCPNNSEYKYTYSETNIINII